MKSFNAYGQTTAELGGGSVPVWLGTVSPVPMGAVFSGSELFLKAGTPVVYNAGERTFTKAASAADANGYLYNDIRREVNTDVATGAIVIYHAEGMLIDNTEFGDWADELQAKIPGVLLVRTAAAE